MAVAQRLLLLACRCSSKMTIKFVLLVNKQGQTRLAKYTDSSLTTDERRALEAEIVRKCLTRADKQARCLLTVCLGTDAGATTC